MLLTDKGKLLPIFFCHKVEVVIANNAINEATIPITGRLVPMSNPKTNLKASQIGWVLDVNETAEKISKRTGRKSRLPARLREAVYGGALNLNKEVMEVNHEEDKKMKKTKKIMMKNQMNMISRG